MPFNSDSYYRNKYRRTAKAKLAKARDIKARAAKGEAYQHEIEIMLPQYVRTARMYWFLYLSERRIARL